MINKSNPLILKDNNRSTGFLILLVKKEIETLQLRVA
jgi:hypothetical protein